MEGPGAVPDVDQAELREAIRCEYREVARSPNKGFHFHTGRALTRIVGYRDEWLEGIPEEVIERFAGTGNPFSIAPLREGERVVDLGCGAGIDSFVAARQVGRSGVVVGIDMTEEMLDQAREARRATDLENVDFRKGYMEDVPVEAGWADVVISNGALNLCVDKLKAYREIHRLLKPGGRIQIGDIMVHTPVSDASKRKIDLWTG